MTYIEQIEFTPEQEDLLSRVLKELMLEKRQRDLVSDMETGLGHYDNETSRYEFELVYLHQTSFLRMIRSQLKEDMISAANRLNQD